jgi:hypothetical protein
VQASPAKNKLSAAIVFYCVDSNGSNRVPPSSQCVQALPARKKLDAAQSGTPQQIEFFRTDTTMLDRHFSPVLCAEKKIYPVPGGTSRYEAVRW